MKPATELPWKVSGTSYVCNDRHIVIPASGMEPDDQAYLVHACNAYPRLVEFVRQFIEQSSPESHLCMDAKAFMRELGEPE